MEVLQDKDIEKNLRYNLKFYSFCYIKHLKILKLVFRQAEIPFLILSLIVRFLSTIFTFSTGKKC